jgi:serine/threonine protein kinase
MLTGEVPFRSKDWFELARMHVEDRPEPLRNRDPALSKRIERIVIRLLAKHPDDRYPSALALLDDLADIEIKAKPTSDIPVPEGYLRDSKTVRSEEEEKKKKGWWKVW